MAEDNGAQSVYVVQRRMDVGEGRWMDVATVEVAPRTRRPTILRGALAGMSEHDVVAGEYRVLDAESAEVLPAVLKEQPPKLVIG